jgi:hypothetical protein
MSYKQYLSYLGDKVVNFQLMFLSSIRNFSMSYGGVFTIIKFEIGFCTKATKTCMMKTYFDLLSILYGRNLRSLLRKSYLF